MKVSGGGFEFSVASSLLPVGPAGKGAAAEHSSPVADAPDSRDFGTLLSKGLSDSGSDSVSQAAKAGSNDAKFSPKLGGSKVASGPAPSKVPQAQRADFMAPSKGSNDFSNPKVGDPSFPQGQSSLGVPEGFEALKPDVKAEDASEPVFLSLPELPPDPRLSDPSELAMEAAAVAALSAASAVLVPGPVQSSVPADSDGSGVAIQVSVQGNGAGSENGRFSQMAQIASRAPSVQAFVPGQVLPQASVIPVEASGGQQSSIASGSNFSPLVTGPVGDQSRSSDSQAQTPLAAGGLVDVSALSSRDVSPSVPKSLSSVPGAPQVQSVPVLPISSPLISLTATPAEVAALVAASSQKAGSTRAIPSQKGAVPAVLPVKLAGDVRSAVLAAKVTSSSVLQKNSDPSAQGSLGVLQEPAEEDVAQPEAFSTGLLGFVAENGSKKLGASGAEDEGKNASGSGFGQESKSSEQGSHNKAADAMVQAKTKLPEAELQSGTRDANVQFVPKEENSVRVRATGESLPASIDEAPQSSSSVDRADSSQSAVSSAFGAANRPFSEVISKPTVLPPVQVKVNEAWRVVQDAIQRARSENPSHLAVEVRMDDGSTLGVELRMSGAGLQASFRSESQALLRSIESQWTAFVSKEPADARVTSAVFESRSSFGGSTDSGTSGGERRQQMEDALSASSLGQVGQSGLGVSRPSGSKPAQIGPVQNGRITAYA